MGLESYEARYTLQLTEWNRRVFDRRGLDVVYVPGTTIDNTQAISVGQVLDAHGRSFFAMSQMMNLVQLMKNGDVTGDDVIYFEDMFQPGFESLGYIMNQIPKEQCPKIYVRCLPGHRSAPVLPLFQMPARKCCRLEQSNQRSAYERPFLH